MQKFKTKLSSILRNDCRKYGIGFEKNQISEFYQDGVDRRYDSVRFTVYEATYRTVAKWRVQKLKPRK